MKKIFSAIIIFILCFSVINTSAFATTTGDINNDYQVNSSDALLILQYSVGENKLTDEQIILADLNKDGVINSTDALMILKIAVGIEINNNVGLTPIGFDINDVPEYKDSPYTVINNGMPYFATDILTIQSYETYSELDSLGRCGQAVACIGTDIMPTEERGNIGSVKPSGWHTIRYDDLVDGKYLYNRCHLIGYQLSGENANEKNLITGTRYLNVDGMLPFENQVADYVTETDNHVLYRVTPIFIGDNLVASGVLIEGFSVEDNGAGVCLNVFCYNVQPNIIIDYASGESKIANEISTDEPNEDPQEDHSIVYRTPKGTHYHYDPDCGGANSFPISIKDIGDLEPCKKCVK